MLERLDLGKFTVFEHVSLEFSPGINVFIGANATGKTHLLKLAYSVIRAWTDLERQESPMDGKKKSSALAEKISAKLTGVFRPEDGRVGRLVRRGRGRAKSTVKVNVDKASLTFTLSTLDKLELVPGFFFSAKTIPTATFLPAREVLSIYPGFLSAYQNREISFDETYYDLCHALSGLPLRGPRGEAASALWEPLGQSLRAAVSLQGDYFYLTSPDDGVVEAHLAAEGFRKVASVMHLIANGSLTKNSILFWDEPEANLNPKLIKIVADFLLRLAGSGVQIFMATHDYLLTNELSLNAEYGTEAVRDAPIRFFGFSRANDNRVDVQSAATLAELTQNPIMEEFEKLYDRERLLFHEHK
jgi:predicted ATPase